MTDSPPLPACVVDTSVLIDLHVGRLLKPVFQLPLFLMAPDVLIAELQEPRGDLLVDYGLTRIELSGDEVQEVYRLATLYRGPSVNDLFALVAAKTMGALLLTGDRHLREAAEREGVLVHGTLWLLDEMLRLAVIPPLVAAQALERMLEKGSRLPWDECQTRFRQWR
jgi:predicted nucleic acid-binding protein